MGEQMTGAVAPRRIACIGEAMIELRPGAVPGPATVGFSGDTLNTAIYMRRSLAGEHSVDFITAVGIESFSDQMLAIIDSHGVGTNRIARLRGRHPGLYAIQLDAEGERSFTYWRGQSAARHMFDGEQGLIFDALGGYDVIYLSGITLAILPATDRSGLLTWLERYRAAGGTIAFDSNYRPALWESAAAARVACDRAWSLCDIALPSLDDEAALFAEDQAAILRRFATYPSARGALKRGADGPLPLNWAPGGNLMFPAALRIMDTTAAGDSFSGTYIAELLNSGDVETAIQRAHWIASQVISHAGAIAPTGILET